jgi:hypothetical protein
MRTRTRTKMRFVNVTVFLSVLGAGASVAVAMAQRQIWPQAGWHQDRFLALADYLDRHSSADDRIFVWGNSPEIYLYAKRRMATRYMSVNYQTGHVWGAPSNDLGGRPDATSVPAQSWDNLMADLAAHRPAFIVDAAAGRLNKMDAEPIPRHPRMAAFVAAHYRLCASVLGVPVYRLIR